MFNVERGGWDTGPHTNRSTPGGEIGEQACSAGGSRWAGGGAMLRRIFDPSEPRGKPVMIEPSWKEARGVVAISSPLYILLVGAPGECKSQPSQFYDLRVGGGATQVTYLI